MHSLCSLIPQVEVLLPQTIQKQNQYNSSNIKIKKTEMMNFKIGRESDETEKEKIKIYDVDVYIFNLMRSNQRERGFQMLKQEQDKKTSNTRAIVCGGDGSFIWVVQQMVKYNCNLDTCPIGIIPFGTGNDLARVLGWGGGVKLQNLFGPNMKAFKERIFQWIQSIVEDFDIWDIYIDVFDQGAFKNIQKKNKNGKKVLEKDVLTQKNQQGIQEPIKIFKQQMSNYLSVGVDARIGLGFDRNRTHSKMANLCVYCWEGFKKCFMKTLKIHQVIDSLDSLHQQENADDDDISNLDILIEDEQKKFVTQFKTKPTIIEKEKRQLQMNTQYNKYVYQIVSYCISKEIEPDQLYLKGQPVTLLILNINSYSAGVHDIWKKSKNKLAVEKGNKNPHKDQYGEQNFKDGKIEFLSFPSISSIGQERIFSGNASRICQGAGPFILRFKKEDENKEPIKTYFQIDGEYYQVISPKTIKIQRSKLVPRGKIKVMIERSSVKTNE